MNDNIRSKIIQKNDSIEEGNIMIFQFCDKAMKDTQLLYEMMFDEILKTYEHIEFLSVDDYIRFTNKNESITCNISLDKNTLYSDYGIRINSEYEENNQVGKFLKNTFYDTKSKEVRYGYYYLDSKTKLLIDTKLLSDYFKEDGFDIKIKDDDTDVISFKISMKFSSFAEFIRKTIFSKTK